MGRRTTPPDSTGDDVILLDSLGRACGTAPKRSVHGTRTPLHLAFSCYLVDQDGSVLLTKRSDAKRMFPAIWTNACCGHPRPGEAMDDAVRRHVRDELGVAVHDLTCVLPDFTYRAAMSNGWVEHEVCPVHVGLIDGEIAPDPMEVSAHEWSTWADLVRRAATEPASLSPWSVAQIARLEPLADDLRSLLRSGSARGPVVAPGTGAPVIDPFAPVRHTERAMVTFLTERTAALDRCDPLAGELTGRIAALITSGGKRVRPAFVHWGATTGGPVTTDTVHAVGAALEMLHTFAIIHDDVMDRSTSRRSRPTMHVDFAALRPDGGFAAADDRFGDAAAILAGDLAFAWAHELLDAAELDPHTRRAVRSLFAVLCSEVVIGQYMDIRLAGMRADDRQAMRIALLKSARYTVTRPLELGATLAGADDDAGHRLREYGDAAGVAFQLRDDVLGVFGDPIALGKPTGDDLREGKASLLIVRAFELADPAGRAALADHVGRHDLDDAGAERCRDVIAASGALASVERLIGDRIEVAQNWAHTFAPETAAALAAMSVALTCRTA